MTISELYNYLKANLSVSFDDAERLALARRIFTIVTGRPVHDTVLYPEREADVALSSITPKIDRINNSEPLEYVFNSAQFLDIELVTNGKVLIPRPETEELAMMVAGYIDKRGAGCRVLDIGTGSGCIPVYLSGRCGGAAFWACDISADALATARENAARNGRRISFVECDILDFENSDPWGGMQFDVIVSNPPYVLNSEKALMQRNVLDYEPHTALFVDDGDPLLFYRRISEFARLHLSEGGRLYFEINERYGKETATLMENCGFGDVVVYKDLFSKDRFVSGVLISR